MRGFLRGWLMLIGCWMGIMDGLWAQPKPLTGKLPIPIWAQKAGYAAAWKLPVQTPLLEPGMEGWMPVARLNNDALLLEQADGTRWQLSTLPVNAVHFPWATVLSSAMAESLGIPTQQPRVVRVWGRSSLLFRMPPPTTRSTETVRAEAQTPKSDALDLNTFATLKLLAFWIGQPRAEIAYWQKQETSGKTHWVPASGLWFQAFARPNDGLQRILGWMDSRNRKAVWNTQWRAWTVLAKPSDADLQLLGNETPAFWQRIAETLQTHFTDERLQEVMKALPPEVRAQYGMDFLNILKKRRARLPEAALFYHQTLQKHRAALPASPAPWIRQMAGDAEYDAWDGLMLGPAFLWMKAPGQPEEARHLIRFNQSFKRWANNLRYTGRQPDILGRFGLTADAHFLNLGNRLEYYALGNEMSKQDAYRYYGAVMQRGRVGLRTLYRSPIGDVQMGGFYESWHMDAAGAITTPQAGTLPNPYQSRTFTGFEALYQRKHFRRYDLVRRAGQQVDIRYKAARSADDERYANLSGDAVWWLMRSPQSHTQLALRMGGAHLFGTFPYYATNRLGQMTNLRGFYQRRFGGRSMAYANAELRGKLWDLSYTKPTSQMGWLMFTDAGRVWADGETSTKIHVGYGFGGWMQTMGWVFSGWMSFSPEYPRGLLMSRVGFQF